MNFDEALLAIITGLAVNECCDVSPWAARKLVRWSAHHRYVPPAFAEVRAEELAALIDDRPGKLFKLITALGFAAAALVNHKVSAGALRSNPQWWPTELTVPVHYEKEHTLGYSKDRAMRYAWRQLTDQIRDSAREIGVGSRSWRRCLSKLQRITEDDRWTLVERNLNLLDEINKSREKQTAKEVTAHGRRCVVYWWSIPTDSTVMNYQAAVETACDEIRRLANDFLHDKAPG
jgi:hypothetical protein